MNEEGRNIRDSGKKEAKGNDYERREQCRPRKEGRLGIVSEGKNSPLMSEIRNSRRMKEQRWE